MLIPKEVVRVIMMLVVVCVVKREFFAELLLDFESVLFVLL